MNTKSISPTPGPWTSDLTGPFTLGGDSREVVALDSEGMVSRSICSCMLDTDAFPNGRDFLEDKSNIQLITLAPELLEVLKSFPQPELPGKANWEKKVIAWWNTKARTVLLKTEIQ